jgi:hypothetical protein
VSAGNLQECLNLVSTGPYIAANFEQAFLVCQLFYTVEGGPTSYSTAAGMNTGYITSFGPYNVATSCAATIVNGNQYTAQNGVEFVTTCNMEATGNVAVADSGPVSSFDACMELASRSRAYVAIKYSPNQNNGVVAGGGYCYLLTSYTGAQSVTTNDPYDSAVANYP